jgi:hypothetical protein
MKYKPRIYYTETESVIGACLLIVPPAARRGRGRSDPGTRAGRKKARRPTDGRRCRIEGIRI